MSDETNGGNGELIAKVDRLHEVAQEVKATAIAQAQESARSAKRAEEAATRVESFLGFLKKFLFVVVAVLVLTCALAGTSYWQGKRNGDAVDLLRECNNPGPRKPTPEDLRTGHPCYDADQMRMRAFIQQAVNELRKSADCLVLRLPDNPICAETKRRLEAIQRGENPFADGGNRLPEATGG